MFPSKRGGGGGVGKAIISGSRERLIEGRLLFEKIRYAVLACRKTTGEY